MSPKLIQSTGEQVASTLLSTLPCESRKTGFNKHPEFSINGNTSLDDELIYMIQGDKELCRLIETDINRCINPSSTYAQLIIKLCIFEFQDIETLIADYKPSKFWDSLDPAKKRELIQKTIAIQEEKEQDSIEAIGTENMQGKRPVRGICSIWQKGL
jgi:hypothetical protein